MAKNIFSFIWGASVSASIMLSIMIEDAEFKGLFVFISFMTGGLLLVPIIGWFMNNWDNE